MKARKAIFWLMLLLPAAICLISLPSLPERIPAHYNPAGAADRRGSKYETLVFPGMNFLFGAIMSAAKKFAAKGENQGENNEKKSDLYGRLPRPAYGKRGSVSIFCSAHFKGGKIDEGY